MDDQMLVKSRRVYQKLLKMAEKSYAAQDVEQLKAAWELVEPIYKEKPDYIQRPFLFYPLEFAQIAAREMRLGVNALLAALFFEAVRSEQLDMKTVKDHFGSAVIRILDGLLKIERISVKDLFDAVDHDQESADASDEGVHKQLKKTRKMLKRHPDKFDMQLDNFRRMMISLAEDMHVILLELALHLYQIRHVERFPEDERLSLSNEVAYIYVPMAHKLGLYALKTEMEDRSLRYLDPEMYKDIQGKLEESREEREQYITNFIRPLRKELRKEAIDFEIKGRTKSIASIRGKIRNKGVPFEQIYDIFAIRIVLTGRFDSLRDEKSLCWHVYSLVTDHYTPSTSRLRDWISQPRETGYESLHTTVLGPENKWVEVQIRTKRMDDIAEKGAAAHWRYKNLKGENAQEEWLERIRSLLENAHTSDLDEDANALMPAGKGNIFVFTPKDELKKLPENASVLDFAYSIHSRVGEQCTGAKINNKVYSIKHRLRNGDRVEIITSNQQKPRREWLTFVESSKAKSRIKSFLNAERNKLAERGRALIQQKFETLREELQKDYHQVKDLEFSDKFVVRLRHNNGYKSTLNFLGDVAEGKVNLKMMKEMMIPEEEPDPDDFVTELEDITRVSDTDTLILADDLGKVDVELARCCNPIPGDKIFGFISATRGTKIHKMSCPNAPDLMTRYPYRVVRARWNHTEENLRFIAGLQLICSDKVGVLARIVDLISRDFNINMGPVNFTPRQDGTYFGDITVYVQTKDELKHLIDRLKRVKGIIRVARNE